MRIFFAHLPQQICKKDLETFIKPAFNSGKLDVFRKRGQLLDLKVFQLRDKLRKTVEYHAVAKIAPDAAAQRIIYRLNNQRLGDRFIQVRKWVRRSWRNDPRCAGTVPYTVKHAVQRKRDRRRRELQFVLLHDNGRPVSTKNLYRRKVEQQQLFDLLKKSLYPNVI